MDLNLWPIGHQGTILLLWPVGYAYNSVEKNMEFKTSTSCLIWQILDELRSLKLWKEKQERKEKGKKKSGRNPLSLLK